jgi:Chlorophyllase enzyme
MRKAEAFLFCAASLASVFSACSDSNSNNPITGQNSGAMTGDAGGTPVINQPVDSGSAPGAADTGTAVVVPKDAGALVDTGTVLLPDTGVADAGGADAVVSSGDPEFDSCYAPIKQLCIAKEMNTAELMEVPCKALQNIALPLTNGMSLGPVTLQAGPYAAKIEWNEGAGTPYASAPAFESDLAEQGCLLGGIDVFAEPAATTDELKNTRMLDSKLFTIFRPACFKKGEKYPVITWANGTCGLIHGYSALLSTLASHGFVIVASNSTWTNTAPTDTVQLKALDYAKALNEDPKSVLYQKLDMEHIGAMGHSQGAAATNVADSDPRIDSIILWNGGVSNEKPFLNVSGERDVSATTPASMTTDVNGATQPGAWVYYHKIPETGGTATGHLTLMEQPERVVDMAIAWWKWQLKGDTEAKKMFVGDGCGLCNMKAEFEYGHNTKLQ